MAEVYLPGQHGGIVKPRPVIVIDDRVNFEPGDRVEVVVVTSGRSDPDGVYVDIPWSADPHRRACTKLQVESRAAVHWIEHIPLEDLDINRYGYCGPGALKRILEAIASIQGG